MGGGAQGVKITIGRNGASVCLRSVAFFEAFTESDILAREKKIKQLAGNSSAGPPTIRIVQKYECMKLGRINKTNASTSIITHSDTLIGDLLH